MNYFSSYYNVILVGDETWFDPRLDDDTDLYIDPLLVFRSEIPFFSNSRERFKNFFKAALEELFYSRSNSNSLEYLEQNILWLPEPDEIRLGTSSLSKGQNKSTKKKKKPRGRGSGTKFSRPCAQALRILADRGYTVVDRVERIQFFASGIGPDGISDATANILKTEFIQYTQKVCQDLNIPMQPCPVKNAWFDLGERRWYPDMVHLPVNPCFESKMGIILVPKKFLCKIPAINREGFNDFLIGKKSDQLRTELNREIEGYFDASEISQIASRYPEWIDEYIEAVENDESISAYDLKKDDKNVYRSQKEAFNIVRNFKFSPPEVSNDEQFHACISLIIDKFRLHVEEQQGFQLLWHELSNDDQCEPIPRDEKAVQRLFLCTVSGYCEMHDIECSREVETGRGPVDFEFSTGHQFRALIEIKLAKNSKLKEGFERQLPTYLNAKQIKHGFYIIVFYEREELEKTNKILAKVTSKKGELSGEIIMIDATREKKSASKL